MPHRLTEARHLSGESLANALRESRACTWSLVNDLTPAQWLPPQQPGVNPIAWELAHLAWFAEFWILRGPHHRDDHGHAQGQSAPRFAGPDALFDSARLAHAARWTETMPNREQLAHMLTGQLEACINAIPPSSAQDSALYSHRLALFHEDMHAEAFCWMRAALGYPAPAGLALPQVSVAAPLAMPGGEISTGYRSQTPGFAFDNELPGRSAWLTDFEIDSAPIRAGEFARFVEAGGYDQPQYWPSQAGAWRARSTLSHPRHWRRDPAGQVATTGWQMCWFDQWVPLPLMSAALHLNAFEAEAYCLWAGRRLPTAMEWEHAAQSSPAFQWGHSVWEWTADAFAPYPGFTPGPYLEYSEPWFGNHRELRGGAFATHARMHNPRYRNFFQAHRCDVFAGFRTVRI
jgi:iron(II)-dependent oxidoreductase